MSERIFSLNYGDAQFEVRIDDDFPPLELAVSFDIRHQHDGGWIELTLDEAEKLGRELLAAVKARRAEIGASWWAEPEETAEGEASKGAVPPSDDTLELHLRLYPDLAVYGPAVGIPLEEGEEIPDGYDDFLEGIATPCRGCSIDVTVKDMWLGSNGEVLCGTCFGKSRSGPRRLEVDGEEVEEPSPYKPLPAEPLCSPEDPCLDTDSCPRCAGFPSGSGG